MAALYTLKITLDFAAAHSLRNYPGACSRLHGHNWKVEAEVVATQLNDVGMGVDFKTIRAATRAIAERLDHQYLNELEPFNKINPTAENIAAYFYNELAKTLNNKRIKVAAITLWETERASVRYSENQ